MTESQSLSPSKLSPQRLFCLCCRTGQFITKLVCRKLEVPVLSFMGPSLFPVQTNQAKVPELQPGGSEHHPGFFPVKSPSLLCCSCFLLPAFVWALEDQFPVNTNTQRFLAILTLSLPHPTHTATSLS